MYICITVSYESSESVIMLSEDRRTERLLLLTETSKPDINSTRIVLQTTLPQITMFSFKNSSEVHEPSILKIVYGKLLHRYIVHYCFHAMLSKINNFVLAKFVRHHRYRSRECPANLCVHYWNDYHHFGLQKKIKSCSIY